MKYKIKGKEYPVRIKRKNNKNTYIRIKDGTIEISTHFLITTKQIGDILKRNEESICKMMVKYEQKSRMQEKFMYLGQQYDIIIMPTEQIECIHHTLYASNQTQLQKWYQSQMVRIFNENYEICYQQFREQIPFYPLRIRKMKTRWGVCNKKSKTITLNSELLKYDIPVIQYVIIHELAHLVHFNHSKEFWEVVATYCPNYKKLRNKLKE